MRVKSPHGFHYAVYARGVTLVHLNNLRLPNISIKSERLKSISLLNVHQKPLVLHSAQFFRLPHTAAEALQVCFSLRTHHELALTKYVQDTGKLPFPVKELPTAFEARQKQRCT